MIPRFLAFLALTSVTPLTLTAADSVVSVPVPVAHRGLFKHAPENTVPAFAACLDLRHGFELDVRRSHDGVLVCIHDDTVNRTTNGTGKVSELKLAELRALDAGRWFDPAFTGERIPTFAEILAQSKKHPIGPKLIALDLKTDDAQFATDVTKHVNDAGLRDRVVCIGNAITDADLRKRLKAADAKLPVAVLAQTPTDLEKAIADPFSDWVYVRFVPSESHVQQARQAKKRVFAAGPLFAGILPENWKVTATSGVDAILTDFPTELRAVVKRR